jgi:hypothetical protein
MCFILIGCDGMSYEEASTEQTDIFNGYFTVIKTWEDTNGMDVYYLLYANDTGVMYFYYKSGHQSGMTPLYNTDGTLQVYETVSSMEEE